MNQVIAIEVATGLPMQNYLKTWLIRSPPSLLRALADEGGTGRSRIDAERPKSALDAIRGGCYPQFTMKSAYTCHNICHNYVIMQQLTY